MRSLGLGHLLGVPTVLVPICPRRVPRFKRPSTPVSTDGEEDYPEDVPPEKEEQPDQESSPGNDMQTSMLDEDLGAPYIPQPFTVMMQWSYVSGGRSAFTRIVGSRGFADYDPFLGSREEQQRWCAAHTSTPYGSQFTQEVVVGHVGSSSEGGQDAPIDRPNPWLREGRTSRMGVARMSPIEASPLETTPRPPRQRERRRRNM